MRTGVQSITCLAFMSVCGFLLSKNWCGPSSSSSIIVWPMHRFRFRSSASRALSPSLSRCASLPHPPRTLENWLISIGSINAHVDPHIHLIMTVKHTSEEMVKERKLPRNQAVWNAPASLRPLVSRRDRNRASAIHTKCYQLCHSLLSLWSLIRCDALPLTRPTITS